VAFIKCNIEASAASGVQTRYAIICDFKIPLIREEKVGYDSNR
jgi:hypothetical protein